MFKLFCLVNNFIIWKRKKKERKKKETSNGGRRNRTRILRISNLSPYHWATETNFTYVCYKICIYIQYGVSDHTTFNLCNPTIPILIKKNLIKCIIKVVNVSKSQYYEFRHNIMNLGNQNSKYSWRIRDLGNPQTGTQFANSVLMYKIGQLQGHLPSSCQQEVQAQVQAWVDVCQDFFNGVFVLC